MDVCGAMKMCVLLLVFQGMDGNNGPEDDTGKGPPQNKEGGIEERVGYELGDGGQRLDKVCCT